MVHFNAHIRVTQGLIGKLPPIRVKFSLFLPRKQRALQICEQRVSDIEII